MNIFDVLWPELLSQNFISCMITPIVKAFKGTKEEVFYTLQDYEKWKENITNCNIKGKGSDKTVPKLT